MSIKHQCELTWFHSDRMLLEEETKYVVVILMARNLCSWVLDLITHVSSSKTFLSWCGLTGLESDWQLRRKRAWDKNMIQLFLVIRWHCGRGGCSRAWLLISDTHEAKGQLPTPRTRLTLTKQASVFTLEIERLSHKSKDSSQHLYDCTGAWTILDLQFPLVMEPNTPLWQQICGCILICPRDFKRNNTMF